MFKISEGLFAHYGLNKIYISVEHAKFSNSTIKELKTFIARQSQNKWYKTIVLDSWLLADQKTGQFKNVYRYKLRNMESLFCVRKPNPADKFARWAMNCIGPAKIKPYKYIGRREIHL